MSEQPHKEIPAPLPAPRPIRPGWLLALVLLGGGWFLVAGLLTPTEAIVGLGALGLTLLLMVRMVRVNLAHFDARPSWLALARQLPGQMLHDSLTVIGVLLRQGARRTMPGRYRVVPFDPGSTDPPSEARRALAVGFTSFAPNSVVVGIDARHHRLLYHELDPQPQVPDSITQLEQP